MIRRRTLSFFGWFALFGAIISFIHLFLLFSLLPPSSLTGSAIAGEPSASVVGSFGLLFLLIAFLFFALSLKRFIPRNVIPRIPLHAPSKPLFAFSERHF